MKALAYLRGDRSVMGHSIIDLLEALETDYPSLAGSKGAAGELDLFYLTSRYPDTVPGGIPARNINKRQAENAVAQASTLCAEARRLVDAAGPG